MAVYEEASIRLLPVLSNEHFCRLLIKCWEYYHFKSPTDDYVKMFEQMEQDKIISTRDMAAMRGAGCN